MYEKGCLYYIEIFIWFKTWVYGYWLEGGAYALKKTIGFLFVLKKIIIRLIIKLEARSTKL
jgi:hypothetical protein